jgi:hypothetical protein
VKAAVGTLSAETIRRGEQLHQALPQELLDAAHDPDDAIHILCALALCSPQQVPRATPRFSCLNEASRARIDKLTHHIKQGPLQWRLPLNDVAMASLQAQSAEYHDRALSSLRDVIQQDGAYSLTECMNLLLAEKYLRPASPRDTQINSLAKVDGALTLLFEALVKASAAAPEAQAQALRTALACLGVTQAASSASALSARALTQAIHQLAKLSPLLKQSVIETAIDAVLTDDCVTLAEFEMLRAFTVLLDCPVPPLLSEMRHQYSA